MAQLTAEIRSLILAEQARQGNRFVEGVDLAEYLAKLADQAELVTDSVDGRVRGVVAYYCNDDTSKQAYISLVLVDPRDRGCGIGKALVARVMALARQRGFVSCRLEVAESNEAAYETYRSLGFHVVEARAHKHLLEAAL